MSISQVIAKLPITSALNLESRRKKLSVPLLFLLVYVFTWGIMLPQVATLRGWSHIDIPPALTFGVGVYGFVWAALITAGVAEGWAGIRRLLGRYLRWRVGLQWYLFALLFPAAYMGLGEWLAWHFDARKAVSPLAFTLPLLQVLITFGVALINFLVFNPEEFAWRGYALPTLQKHYSPLAATLLLAVVEGLWHLPYFFVTGSFYQQIGIVAYLAWNIALAIIATWLFNHTQGSLLPVTLLHAAGNAWETLLAAQGYMIPFYFNILILWLVALTLIGLTQGRLGNSSIDSTQKGKFL